MKHYAKAIAILELHLDKGNEQLTADATKAKDRLDDVIYSGDEFAIFAIYPDGSIICQPSLWATDRYELQHFGKLVRPGGLFVVGRKGYRELKPDELYDVAWELRENLNLQLNSTIELWGELNQAVLDKASVGDVLNKVRWMVSHMESEKSPSYLNMRTRGSLYLGLPTTRDRRADFSGTQPIQQAHLRPTQRDQESTGPGYTN